MWPVSHPYTHTVDCRAGGHVAATVMHVEGINLGLVYSFGSRLPTDTEPQLSESERWSQHSMIRRTNQ